MGSRHSNHTNSTSESPFSITPDSKKFGNLSSEDLLNSTWEWIIERQRHAKDLLINYYKDQSSQPESVCLMRSILHKCLWSLTRSSNGFRWLRRKLRRPLIILDSCRCASFRTRPRRDENEPPEVHRIRKTHSPLPWSSRGWWEHCHRVLGTESRLQSRRDLFSEL